MDQDLHGKMVADVYLAFFFTSLGVSNGAVDIPFCLLQLEAEWRC
jgi:hypothetical protein